MTAQPADAFDDEGLYGMINEELLARRVKVMFLKNAGATWKAISDEVGVSIATCRKDYSVVCRDINNENPADVVARHRAVTFDIQRANYTAMMRGDKDAAATILRALRHEADLLGLFPPAKVAMPGAPEDWANEAAALIERIVALDPTSLKELTRARGQDPAVIDVQTVEPGQDGGAPAPAASAGGAAPDHGPTGRGADGDGPGTDSGSPGGPDVDGIDLSGGWSNI